MKKLLKITVGITLLGVLVLGVCYFILPRMNPEGMFDRENVLKRLDTETVVYFNDGEALLGSFFQKEHRRYLSYEQIPVDLQHAVVAGEDAQFYSHIGFSPISILRAVINNALGKPRQGGSTLTQQTAKNLFGRSGSTYQAKLLELLQALRLEHHFSKKEILEFYLNQFYVVGTGRGVGIASEYFFNRELKDLTLRELAFIAASLKGPMNYDPFIQKDSLRTQTALKRGRERVKYILDKMLENEFIGQAQYAKALKDSLRFERGSFRTRERSVMQRVLFEVQRPEFQKVFDSLGIDSWQNAGLKIITSLDSAHQHHLQNAVDNHLEVLKEKLEADIMPQGGAVLLDRGWIKAYVGGYKDRGYDRVSLAQRQFGSTWKTPLIALALEEGWSLNDVLENENNLFQYGRQFYYPRPDHKNRGSEVTLQWALTKSENIASVWLLAHLLDKVSLKRFGELAEKYGFAKRDTENWRRHYERLRDDYGILFHQEAMAEVHFEKAKEKFLLDRALDLSPGEYRFFKNLPYGRDFNQEFKRKKSSVEKRRFLSHSFLRTKELMARIDRGDESLFYVQLDSLQSAVYEWKPEKGTKISLPDSTEKLLVEGKVPLALLRRFVERVQSFPKIPKTEWTQMQNLFFHPQFRMRVSLDHFASFVKEVGLDKDIPSFMSLPLGVYDVNLLRMTSVYQTLQTGHEYLVDEEVLPYHLIERIEDSEGKILFQKKIAARRILKPSTCAQVSLALKTVVDAGTGKRVRRLEVESKNQEMGVLRFPAGGKTGTTNSFKNAAFLGQLPSESGGKLKFDQGMTLGVYVGFDDNRPMVHQGRKISGSSGALPIWVDFAKSWVRTEKLGESLDFNHVESQLEGEFLVDWGFPVEKGLVAPLTGLPSKDSSNQEQVWVWND